MKSYLGITMCLVVLSASGAIAADTVNSQITDAVTQANDAAPSGRPWHTDNFVLRNEFRHDGTPAPGSDTTVDAMPTPVNGQVTDAMESNIKSPGVYINEEDAFPNSVQSSPEGAVDDADIDLNYVNHSNDENSSGAVIFHKDEPTSSQTD